MKNQYLLGNRAIIQISGDEVLEFLNGLLTNEIKNLTLETGIYSAILTPNGRFMFDLFIFNSDDGIIYIDTADIFLQDLVNFLNKYKLRRNIEIKICENFMVLINFDDNLSSSFSFKDPRSNKIGFRNIIVKDGNIQFNNNEYNSLLISEKIVDGRFIPQKTGIILEYNFEEMNGISFTKGCYLGQELMMRIKRNGEIRKEIKLCNISDVINDDIITFDDKKKLILCYK